MDVPYDVNETLVIKRTRRCFRRCDDDVHKDHGGSDVSSALLGTLDGGHDATVYISLQNRFAFLRYARGSRRSSTVDANVYARLKRLPSRPRLFRSNAPTSPSNFSLARSMSRSGSLRSVT